MFVSNLNDILLAGKVHTFFCLPDAITVIVSGLCSVIGAFSLTITLTSFLLYIDSGKSVL